MEKHIHGNVRQIVYAGNHHRREQFRRLPFLPLHTVQ